jgi:hypothetical protein
MCAWLHPLRAGAVRGALVVGAALLVAAPSVGASAGVSDLRVDVRLASASGPPDLSWRVTCGPPAGTLPDPAAACRGLDTARARRLLGTPPCRTLAEDEYRGPAVLTVRGRLVGRRVALTLRRTTTCAIARWDEVTRLLGVPFAPAPAP